MMATQPAQTPARNVMLCYPNRIDEAVLSGGNWSVNAPLDNAHDRLLAVKTRSVDVDPISTVIDIVFPAQRLIRVVALIAHNLTAVSSYRVSVSQSPDFSAGNVIGTQTDVWPIIYPFGTIPWEHPSFWTGRAVQEDIEGYPWSLVHVLPSVQLVRSIRIEIDDHTNLAGFVEFGRIFAGDGWQPDYNMRYGASIQYNSRADVAEALSGAETFDRLPSYRSWRLQLHYLSDAEALTRVLEMQRVLGVHGELLLIHDQTDTIHRHRTSFLGRLSRLNAIEKASYRYNENDITIKEII